MLDLNIEGRIIGVSHPPFVVAEMSGNHNQSLEQALSIVDAAADAGAHALKLQTFTPDTLTLDCDGPDFVVNDGVGPWAGKTMHELYVQAQTPWDWHSSIIARCRERGIVCFSTPFDETAVDFLEAQDVACYKIASFEIVHLPLIRRVAATGKPIILSTGMATVAEISEAVDATRREGCRDLVLLRCTSAYPASPAVADLATLPHMRTLFGCEVGLSDHTLGTAVSVAAVALGAVLLEKHFTLSRAAGGVDAGFSVEPSELATLVRDTDTAWRAVGSVRYGPTDSESASLGLRRSLYLSADMQAGEAFTEHNLRVVRPSWGLHPRFYELLLGKRIKRDATKGTPVTWELLL